mmetsp:Transcript_3570/g.7362  ORF Transcript_3570/g.7362 Transcript_3570/m.7362 type:complete len:250 (-) Transcript_3570:2172-2921(-)
MNRKGSQGFDKHITIFSPTGRLFQVEYAFNASQNFGTTCIALKGKDSICAIINKKQTKNPNETDLKVSFLGLGGYSGVICTGFPGDHQMQIQDVLWETSNFTKNFYQNMPMEDLARRVSDKNQTLTQQAFMRPLGVKTLLFDIDDEFGPQLFKCDPAGFFSQFSACSIGEKEAEISNYLKKKNNSFIEKQKSFFSTISNTISILQHVLKIDIKAIDISVIVSVKGKYNCKQLSEKEVDYCLNFLRKREI